MQVCPTHLYKENMRMLKCVLRQELPVVRLRPTMTQRPIQHPEATTIISPSSPSSSPYSSVLSLSSRPALISFNPALLSLPPVISNPPCHSFLLISVFHLSHPPLLLPLAPPSSPSLSSIVLFFLRSCHLYPHRHFLPSP